MSAHAVTVAALTDALILMAVAMLVTRTLGLLVRGAAVTREAERVPAGMVRPI